MEKITKESNGNIIEITKNDNGNVVSELYYDKDKVLFQKNEYFYDENNREIKVVKTLTKTNQTTNYLYEYDENGNYSKRVVAEVEQFVTKRTKHTLKNGEEIKTEIYNMVPVPIIRETTKKKDRVYCCEDLINPLGQFVDMNELTQKVLENKIYTADTSYSDLLDEIVQAINNEKWADLSELAAELQNMAEDKISENKKDK